MRKLAIPLITFLALALLVGTIGYVVVADAPAPVAVPVLTSMPTTTPVPTPEPTLVPEPSSEPTPTTIPIATPTPTPPPTPASTPEIGQEPASDNVFVYYGEQPPYARTEAGYDRVQLIDSGSATDPTWQQLESFLIADKTDEKDYVLGTFMCGAFAEELHNNAEAAGIRAAWVTADFKGESEGHALNAFYTTDMGLFYIDCGGKTEPQTGNTQSVGLDSTASEGLRVYGKANSWDKVAYVSVGKELRLVSLDVVSCPQYVCYEYYEQREISFEAALGDYNQKAEDYNSEVAAFNEWVAGKVFVEGTSEAETAHQWSDELGQEKDRLTALAVTLDKEGKSLGAFWQPLGVVSKVEIYW